LPSLVASEEAGLIERFSPTWATPCRRRVRSGSSSPSSTRWLLRYSATAGRIRTSRGVTRRRR